MYLAINEVNDLIGVNISSYYLIEKIYLFKDHVSIRIRLAIKSNQIVLQIYSSFLSNKNFIKITYIGLWYRVGYII